MLPQGALLFNLIKEELHMDNGSGVQFNFDPDDESFSQNQQDLFMSKLKAYPHKVEKVKQLLKMHEEKISLKEVPIDKDFDYVNFPSLSPRQQLKSIPKEFYQSIELPKRIRTRSHCSCMLVKHPDNHSGTWDCDKVEGVNYCLSGLTGFYQSKGIAGWRCSKCDFDICIKCAQADRFIEMLLSRED